MISNPIAGGTAFWGKVSKLVTANGGVAHCNDGDLQYAAIAATSRMTVIRRTAEELFSTTVARAVKNDALKVAVNANMFDVTKSGLADAFLGHDPVPATETSPIGHVISGGKLVDGTPEPSRFFLENVSLAAGPPVAFYQTDQGNPPSTAPAAVGGLGPIIIKNLKFGTGNLYGPGVPAGAPVTGDPGPTFKPFLIQRNNAHYIAYNKKARTVGKAAFAHHKTSATTLLLVLPDGVATGLTLDEIRDKLVGVSTDDAVFFDGSDSVMLVVNGTFHVSQGEDKDELTTIGLGFT